LYQLAADEIKETAGRLKEYKKTDFAELIISADSVISENQDAIQQLEQQEDEQQDRRNSLQEKIVSLIEVKLPTTYDGPNIKILQRSEKELETSIETLQQDIESAEQEIVSLKQTISEKKIQLKTIDVIELQKNLQTLSNLETDITKLNRDSKLQQGIINAKQEKINHLESHEYDPACKYCVSNVFVQNAIEAKNTIDQDREVLADLNAQITDIDDACDALGIYRIQESTFNKLKAEIDKSQNILERLELKLQILESDLQTKESELETCLERQESFEKNVTAIEHNEKVDISIATCKTDITDCTDKIKSIQESIKSMYGAIEVAKTQKATAMSNLESYQQLEIEYKAYEYYLDSVKRDGVPYEIVAKAVPKIEAEINNVLNQIVDFNMVMSTDGKNINGYIIYDEDNYWPLELTSGMERFISSLAIRIALINVSALPRPNFIAIDEGWGSLDQEHIASVVNLFDYFRTKFDFSIIISHVDSMRDMVDNLIEVNKINGYSQINHV
jgi:DNA repair exonuclease SbcCD ATPase subunit